MCTLDLQRLSSMAETEGGSGWLKLGSAMMRRTSFSSAGWSTHIARAISAFFRPVASLQLASSGERSTWMEARRVRSKSELEEKWFSSPRSTVYTVAELFILAKPVSWWNRCIQWRRGATENI